MRDQLQERYGKPHLSYSSLKYALGDMRQFEKYMRREMFKESDALRFGSLYDCLLLTPNLAPDQYIVMDEEELIKGIKARNIKATKEYKERVKTFQDTAKDSGRTVVTSEDWQKAEDMISRLDDEGLLDRVLTGGEPQVEFNEDVDGIPLKGFIDYLHPDYVCDSKSSRSMDKFRYDVNSFCYDIQAYIYTLVTGRSEFYWLVQEKTDPYYPGVVKCTDKTLFAGEMKFNEAVSNIQQWLETPESELEGFAQFEV
mgnify:FL=1|tara:strand:- start:2525 stop:3289 length:765 start_codon:yes stop_codon:yes gene_type:complete